MTCDGFVQGWEAVEAKTEAMDAFVNVATDMQQLMQMQQQWSVTEDSIQGMSEALQMQV